MYICLKKIYYIKNSCHYNENYLKKLDISAIIFNKEVKKRFRQINRYVCQTRNFWKEVKVMVRAGILNH